MASLDSLPADQRAVLDLVLQRGRSYDEIAQMLSIDRAGVRQRALSALDALGPQTRVEPFRRALITDYLLGQLPAAVSEQTRMSLARSPAERAWARVVASELSPVARDPLPEIPVHEPAGAPTETPPPRGAWSESATSESATSGTASAGARAAAPAQAAVDEDRAPGAGDGGRPRSSRLGGALLLGGSAAVVVAVVLVLLLTGGGGKKHTSTAADHAATTPASTSTNTSTTAGKIIAQVNLNPPSGTGKAKGIAQIVSVNKTLGVVILATGVAANSHNAYAVWLYNSPTSTRLVGFVSPGVGSNGQLQTEGQLPSDASSFTHLLITLETQAHPKSPGQVILQGTLSIPAGS